MLARRYAVALRQGHNRKLLIVGVGRQIGRYCRGSIDQPASDEHTDSPEPYDGHGEQRQLLYLAHVENYSFASYSAALHHFSSPSHSPMSGVATCPSGPWRRPLALRPAARNVSARRGLQRSSQLGLPSDTLPQSFGGGV